jgi:1-deoxy-D-xylulose-5-phosphate synthase
VVALEDNAVSAGFGSALLELLSQQSFKGDVLCIGIPDEFVEQGRVEILLELLNMKAESIIERIFARWPELASRITLELRKFGQS